MHYCGEGILEFSYADQRILTEILKLFNNSQVFQCCMRALLDFGRALFYFKKIIRRQNL